MKSVNSLSGGRTSSFMALNYPAKYNVFALVCIEAQYCKPKDKSIIKYVSNKINKDFIATAESDKTLYALRDLEQLIGSEIIWVSGNTFEEVVNQKKILPNQMMRFCTSEMKIKPIFDFCQNQIKEIVEMQIGFRYDEKERAESNKNNTTFKTIVGKHPNGNNKWGEIEWRKLKFPLVDNLITSYNVNKWAKNSKIQFPDDSNCVGCFWKPFQQLRKNWEDEPQKMRWFSEMEKQINGQWKKEMSYKDVKKIGLQMDFFFGTGSGCQSGFCTD